LVPFKYDFITGIGVHYFGHSNPMVVGSALDSSVSDILMQGNLQQDITSYELSRRFISLANRDNHRLTHCFLTSSGAMANENALKIVFQKQHPRGRVLAFEGCFMGRTLALSQITDKPKNRLGLPHTLDVDNIPFFNYADPKGSTDRSIKVLMDCIDRYPDQHALMCFEMVQGEGGFYPGEVNFFLELISVLKNNNIMVMVDEVQTFARTYLPFAFQYFGLDDYIDIVTVGKMTQVCATLFTDELKPKPGLVSQTYTSSSGAIVVANMVLDELNSNNYFGSHGKIAVLHDHFIKRLTELEKKYPDWIAGPFGFGLMIAFTPFDGTIDIVSKLAKTLFEDGVICFIAGSNPTRIRFLVPVMTVTTDDIDRVCGILELSMSKLAKSM
jgi:4-aminobutyrate aminotransferase-like enzyme